MLTVGQRKEHVLNRVGYGPGIWHSDRYDQLGADAYVAEQLAQSLPAVTLGVGDVFINTKLERSVGWQRQLEAVLLDFWFNHFNVNATSNNPNRDGNPIQRQIHKMQNDAIAPNLLGVFGDMLVAVAKSTSMLNYLNNDQNRKPQQLNNGQWVGYNENYARELMELHTIGVNGGYDEQDVQEATRILTGWGRVGRNTDPEEPFIYRQSWHDVDEKTIMDVTYPAGGGLEEGEAFLDYLATHPSAANFLGYKLCVRFIGENPPASAIQQAAQAFTNSSGDLGAVTAAILTSSEFAQADFANFRSKIKPPHRYVASALMTMGASTAAEWDNLEGPLVTRIINAGDTPYFFGPPTGYPEAAGYWLSTASVLTRFDMAERIAYKGTLVDSLVARLGVDGSDITETFDALIDVALPGGVSASTEAAIKDHAAANAMSNRQRVSAITHMTFCSPEFLRY